VRKIRIFDWNAMSTNINKFMEEEQVQRRRQSSLLLEYRLQRCFKMNNMIILLGIIITRSFSVTAFSPSGIQQHTFTMNSNKKTKTKPNLFLLNAVSKKKLAVLDGSEWISLQNYLNLPPAPIGKMTVVSGTTLSTGDRVVGIECPSFIDTADISDDLIMISSDCRLYANSVALIPKNLKDDLAMSTLVASLSAIHCALPTRSSNIGGSRDEFQHQGRVVVVGGSDYACFVAR
jgi:hypothetical protein